MNVFWLKKAMYDEEERKIVREFANASETKVKKESFFPHFFVSREIQLNALKDLLKASGERFILEETPYSWKISARTFSTLKKLKSMLENSFSISILLLSPERQFLIEKNESFFQEFVLFNNEFHPSNVFSIPECSLDSTLLGVKEELGVLLQESALGKENAEAFISRLALSHALSLPFQELPENRSDIAERFLENIFFKNQFPIPTPSHEVHLRPSKTIYGSFENIAEIDFGGIWHHLLFFPSNNIGFESLNCSCCSPTGIFDSNLSMHSLIEVVFQKNFFYYSSSLPTFAQNFHQQSPSMEKRDQLMKLNFLTQPPIGPFQLGQTAKLPLIDVLGLLKENSVKVLHSHELKWFCAKQESFLSRALNEAHIQLDQNGKKLVEMQKDFLSRYQLLSSTVLSLNLNYLFAEQFYSTFFDILQYTPKQLTNPQSAFFIPSIARSIQSIQLQVIEKFKSFLLEKNSRLVAHNSSKIFVESAQPLHISSQFLKSLNVSTPVESQKFREFSFI